MSIAIAFGMGSLTLLLRSTPVDFKIDGTPPLLAAAQAPTPLAAPPASAPQPTNPAPPPALHWRAGPVALGFGQDVPLAFAVRQIAPSWVHVSYGDSVDNQVRVSWHGGRPWDQVLGGILTPLGLHMRLAGRTLWIQD